jgi:hypothetical protein
MTFDERHNEVLKLHAVSSTLLPSLPLAGRGLRRFRMETALEPRSSLSCHGLCMFPQPPSYHQ